MQTARRGAAASRPVYRPISPPTLSPQQLTHQLTLLQHTVSALQREVQDLNSASSTKFSALRRAFLTASSDPRRAAATIILLVRHAPESTLLDVARICLNEPVGRVGHRHSVRTVGLLLCNELLERQPNNADALCLKGEALLPYIHYGKNDPGAPRSVLQEAYELFDSASKQGSTLGTFLKGRWLLSMEPLHKNAEQASLGVTCVKTAAFANCPRALVFLAHRYECPQLDRTVSFAADLPKGKTQRERFILSFYRKAADRGDPDALNDIGTSYAEGYGPLECDFDRAVEYYVRAIKAGSLHAFDNLGTHYETGMAGRFPDRIDFEKALYYYRQGACQRCPKCAYNLAAAHEEGMSGTLPKDSKKAERYYIYAIRLADDANDIVTAAKAAKDLVALYFTRIKLNEPSSAIVISARKRLFSVVGDEAAIHRAMLKINKAISTAIRGRQSTSLSKLLGDVNSKLIVKLGKDLDQRVKNGDNSPQNVLMLKHVLGRTDKDPESPDGGVSVVGQKRTRSSTRRATNNSRKKRRTAPATRKSTAR